MEIISSGRVVIILLLCMFIIFIESRIVVIVAMSNEARIHDNTKK